MKQLVVIGAGPIGLHAAAAAKARGLEVTVLERDRVGASLRRWGAARFFSPLGMNVSPAMRALLAPLEDEALLTGPEYCERVLEPLAARLGCVKLGHRVLSIARRGMIRGDYPSHPVRAEKPFQMLVETPAGEALFAADAVFDASGVYGQPLAMGPGGLPARGERAASEKIVRHLDGVDARLTGARVLVVGHGHSAANAIASLAEVGAKVVWCTRAANLRPCSEVPDDPLPERQRVVARANELAMRPPDGWKIERRAEVEAIARDGAALRVQLGGGREAQVDWIVSLTGYRPELSFLSELALEISPATEGAARLMRALANVTDCLSSPRVSPEDLASGEPGFHLVGSKSYGRARTFLLQTGFQQLDTILSTPFSGSSVSTPFSGSSVSTPFSGS
jgi:thioredoxin reductase